jgi:hypothetical protein
MVGTHSKFVIGGTGSCALYATALPLLAVTLLLGLSH